MVSVSGTGRGAVFNSGEPQLMWRGSSGGEFYAMRVVVGASPKVRHYSLPGNVLAASYLGRRIVVVLADSERIWVRVIGKHLARVDEIEHPVGAVEISPEDVQDILSQPIRPVYFASGHLLLRLRDIWWEIDRDDVRQSAAVALAPGGTLDLPRQVWASGTNLYLSDAVGTGLRKESSDVFEGPLLGPGGYSAWSAHPRVWTVHARTGEAIDEIGVDEGDQVIALTQLGGEAALVTVTASGRIVRHVTARSSKTWTAWAGPAHFDVHPLHPWLVRSDAEGVLVGDLRTGETLLDLKVTE